MSTIRVLLADDHAIVREGLKSLINSQSGMEVIGEAADGLSAVSLTAELDPDTGAFILDADGGPIAQESGLLVRWSEVEYLLFVEM